MAKEWSGEKSEGINFSLAQRGAKWKVWKEMKTHELGKKVECNEYKFKKIEENEVKVIH